MNIEFEKEIGLINIMQYKQLENSLIILFGLGGVGGYTFEMLIRCGIQNFILIDKDKFEITNLNRQLAADYDTIDKYKTDVYKNRGKIINKNANIISLNINIDENTIYDVFNYKDNFSNIDKIFVIDCIDDINAKIEIIKYCNINNISIISSMGTANHISTQNIEIVDIKNTKYCPIAKIIRKKLKELSIDSLNCLYINEKPIYIDENGRHISTISYVPATCGIKIAEFVIKKIILH